MNLYLRLLLVLLGSHFKRRIGFADEAVSRWRVLPGDLDLFGHMNNSRFLSVMDLARVDFVIRLGLLGKIMKRRWMVPIGSATLDFRAELRAFERYEVRTRLERRDKNWFYFRQEFRRLDGTLVGLGHVKAIFRDKAGPLETEHVLTSLFPEGSELPALTASDAPRPEAAATPVESPSHAKPAREPIAIVGIGCRLPGGVHDASSFWHLLLQGTDAIVDIPPSRWEARRFHDPSGKSPGRTYVQRAGMLTEDPYAFDAAFFEMSPREAETLDVQQALLLKTSWEAFEDAGIPPSSLAGSKTGVFMGGFMMDTQLVLAHPENRHRIATNSATAATLTMLSNRLSYFYDLKGPSISLDTACSSSMVAIHSASESLWSGQSEVALAGGVNAILFPQTQITMAKGHFLSPTGHCHAFSDKADGYVRAEGAAVLVLKTLSAALRDGNTVYALIRGTAVNQDGRTEGITVPSQDAQVAVMRDAYQKAGIAPSRVGYVEAHGTGTPIGDPIEARAIGTVMGEGRTEACLMGSVKTNVGHLEAAAGVTGVIKAALAVKHHVVPAHLNLGVPNPHIPFAALGLKVPSTPAVLPASEGLRIAGANSFGYGGTNAHVVLTDLPARAATPVAPRRVVLPLSAKTPDALLELCARYARALPASQDELVAFARSAAVHRSHHAVRVAVHCDGPEALQAALSGLKAQAFTGPGVEHVSEAPANAKPVFVYAGMGPQWWAMGRGLWKQEPVYREALERCDRIFRSISGFSIVGELLRDEGASRINRTEYAQPANAVLQWALTQLYASWGIKPAAVLGHSVGEVVAAQVGGSLSLEEMLAVAFHRSRLQQLLAGRGGMLAVGLAPREAEEWARRFGTSVAVAAINSESAVTLAGARTTLDRIAQELEQLGRFQRFLDVEVPYHSPVMDEVLPELRSSLASLRPAAAQLPTYSTVLGRPMGADRHDAGYWCANVRETVRFSDAVGRALDDGYRVFLEVGPHAVLATSLRECFGAKKVSAVSVASLSRKQDDAISAAQSLARLYAAGVNVDWKGYYGEGAYVPVPKYPWQARTHWAEARRATEERIGVPSAHPFLTRREAEHGSAWSYEVNLSEQSYLSDHVVGGAAIFPAAAQVELALAVQRALKGDGPASVEQLELTAPVPLRPQDRLRLFFDGSPDTPSFQVHWQVGEEPAALCARGKLFSAPSTSRKIDIDAELARLPSVLEPAALYAGLERRGLSYGPAFRAVTKISCGEREVVAHLELPEGVSADGYLLHPVLLDAALHSLLGVGGGKGDRRQIVPTSIDEVQLLKTPGARAVAIGKLEAIDDTSFRGDITLTLEDGTVVAEVRGLRCRVLGAKEPGAEQRLARVLHARTWQPIELEAAAPPTPSWVVLTDAIAPEALVEKVKAATAPVWVLDLRGPASSASPVEEGTAAAWDLLGSLRALERNAVERYWVVAEDGALGCAPRIGVARTAMTERPDLKVSLVECAREAFAGLEQHLPKVGSEQELAFRDGRWFAGRIEAQAPAANPRPTTLLRPAADVPAFELSVEAGKLETLAFAQCDRQPPKALEVEVEMEVASLNFKDVMKALGLISHRISASTLSGDRIGMEGSGRVTAVGEGVETLKPGDRVYVIGSRVLASHVTFPATRVSKLPDFVDFTGGSSLIVFLTVYHSLVDVAKLQKGERVLVHGATGGVGLAAIQIARLCGAEVIATAGTDAKRRYLRELGVEKVSSSRDTSFYEDVRGWTNGRGVDVVLNFTPGEVMLKSVQCLAPFGRFIELGKISFDQDAALNLRAFNEGLLYASIDFDRIVKHKPALVADLSQRVLRHFESRELTPLPATVFGASEVADAFRLMARSQHIGKVSVSLKDPKLVVQCPAPPRLRPDATYLVTGGLGGFGLEVARWLKDEGARHLALVGRRGASSPEAVAALEALRHEGVDARAFAADVADEPALARVLAEVRGAMPALAGVIHSAAVLDDRPLDQIDRASLDAVMGPKAAGAWNLHRLTQDAPLDFFVMFSSISSLMGNAGQAAYVAANQFLDQLAWLRRRAGLPATSLQWGVLGEAGMVTRSAGLKAHLERLGMRALSNADALFALGHVIDTSPTELAVVDIDWAALASSVEPGSAPLRLEKVAAQSSGDGAALGPTALERLVEGLDDEASLAKVEAALLRICSDVTRVPLAELSATRPLREVGLDSLMAMELLTSAESEFGVKIAPMVIMGGPPVRRLATAVLDRARSREAVKVAS